jgi:sugar lactone lactonase YvrE
MTSDFDLLASTPGIAEGPCWVDDEVWFTDLVGGITRVRGDGTVVSMLLDRRGVGGLVAHAAGGVVASGRSLIHVSADGAATELVSRPQGSTGFNDLHVTPDGDVLTGILQYRPMAGEPPVPGILARVAAQGLEVLHTGPAWPNGIGSAADGSGAIYLADFATGTVLRIRPDGGVETLATLDEGHADGLAVDSTGRIWVATGPGATLVALSPRGSIDRRVHFPVGFVSSVALGSGGAAALVTVAGRADGTGGILGVELDAEGVPLPPANLPLAVD